MIEIEVQNETYQSQTQMRFASVPRIGEGLRLMEPGGFWASYDVLDVWYQKAEFGDVWVPYLHVRRTAGEAAAPPPQAAAMAAPAHAVHSHAGGFGAAGHAAYKGGEVVPFAT